MVRFGAKNYDEEERRYERRYREKEWKHKDYHEEDMRSKREDKRFEKRDREKERKHKEYERERKCREFMEGSEYERYLIREFLEDPEYVKYHKERRKRKEERKQEKALREKDKILRKNEKLKETSECKIESAFEIEVKSEEKEKNEGKEKREKKLEVNEIILDTSFIANLHLLPSCVDSSVKKVDDDIPKEVCKTTNVLEDLTSKKIPHGLVTCLDPQEYVHPNFRFNNMLGKLHESCFSSTYVGFDDLFELHDSCYPSPKVSFETMNYDALNPYYSSKLTLRVMNQDLNEFIDKCCVAFYGDNLVHRNTFEGCVGFLKTNKHVLNEEHFVSNNFSTLGFIMSTKGLHVELIDGFTTTPLLTLPIVAKPSKLQYDAPNVFEEVDLLPKDPSFVCDKENIHEIQGVFEPLKRKSVFSIVTKSNTRMVYLIINVNSKRYYFVLTFKFPYLGYEGVGMLLTQDRNLFHPLTTYSGFSQFPFDPGGELTLFFVSLTCTFLHVGYDGAKFEVEFLPRRRE